MINQVVAFVEACPGETCGRFDAAPIFNERAAKKVLSERVSCLTALVVPEQKRFFAFPEVGRSGYLALRTPPQ